MKAPVPIWLAVFALGMTTLALEEVAAGDQAEDSKPGKPPPDLPVPAGGWATRKPNPKVQTMPDNSWMVLATEFRPKGVSSYGNFKFGTDYRGFGHAKGEVCLVYDEAQNVTVWFGGCSSGYTNQTLLLSISDAAWYQAQPEHIDFTQGKLRNAKDRPHGQCSYGACYDPVDQRYIKGMGICSGWPYDLKIWAYEIGKNQWQELAPWKTEGTGRAGCYRIVYDRANRLVVLFGGLPMENNATWTFDVAKRQWNKVKVKGPSPRGRIYHHMVYDDKNRKTVLFGGAGGKYGKDTTYLDDTWTFDAAASTWTEMKPKDHPSPRDRGAMAYDSANAVCVLVGGKHGPENRIADTWVYDLAKNEWREMKPAGQPPHNHLYQSAYDRINNVTVYVADGKTYLYRYAAPKAK